MDEAYESVLIDGDDREMIGTDNSMDCSFFLGEACTDRTKCTGYWVYRQYTGYRTYYCSTW